MCVAFLCKKKKSYTQKKDENKENKENKDAVVCDPEEEVDRKGSEERKGGTTESRKILFFILNWRCRLFN